MVYDVKDKNQESVSIHLVCSAYAYAVKPAHWKSSGGEDNENNVFKAICESVIFQVLFVRF